MQLVFLTALGVGGATLFGTILGFVLKTFPTSLVTLYYPSPQA